MATAIDFKALMAEERRRAREAASGGVLTVEKACDIADPMTPPPRKEPLYRLPTRTDRPTFDAESHHVSCSIEAVHHVADWICAEEEGQILACIDAAPPADWTKLRGRRLQSLGGLPLPPPDMSTSIWLEAHVHHQLLRTAVSYRLPRLSSSCSDA